MSQLSPLAIVLIALSIPLASGLLAFWIWMLVECLRSKRLSGQDRLVWVIVIVAVKLVGALIYYLMEHRASRRTGVA